MPGKSMQVPQWFGPIFAAFYFSYNFFEKKLYKLTGLSHLLYARKPDIISMVRHCIMPDLIISATSGPARVAFFRLFFVKNLTKVGGQVWCALCIVQLSRPPPIWKAEENGEGAHDSVKN